MTTYGYYLSGSDGEKDEIKEKRRKIRAYALLNDFEIEHIFVEREVQQFKSLNKRPKGKKLLNLLEGKNVLIAVKLSDVFYSAQETLNTIQLFKKHNIDLHIIETGGRLMFDNTDDITFLFTKLFADFEKRIQQEKKSNDIAIGPSRRGKIPFGFNKQDGQLITNTHEQSIISEMEEMHINGCGYLSIAKEVVEKHNIMFSHMGIKKILERNSEFAGNENDIKHKTI